MAQKPKRESAHNPQPRPVLCPQTGHEYPVAALHKTGWEGINFNHSPRAPVAVGRSKIRGVSRNGIAPIRKAPIGS